jgi:hypothetical protein
MVADKSARGARWIVGAWRLTSWRFAVQPVNAVRDLDDITAVPAGYRLVGCGEPR